MKTGLLTVQPLTHVAGGDATTLPYNNFTNGSFESFTSGASLSASPTNLLLHMDGLDSGTIFTDSSSRANPVTSVGGVHTHAAVKKFGISSAAFNGTTDYLTIATDQKLTNGSFETWTALTEVLSNGNMETWTGLTNLFTDGGFESWVNPWLRSNGDIDTEEFTALTAWANAPGGSGSSTVVTFDSKSCVKNDTGASLVSYTAIYQDIGTFGASTVFSMNLYFSAIGTDAQGNYFLFSANDGAHVFQAKFSSDAIKIKSAAGPYVAIGTNPIVQGVWQEWTFKVTWGASATVDMYLNGALHAAGIDCAVDDIITGNGMVQFLQYGSTTINRITYIDWFMAGSTYTQPLTNWQFIDSGVGASLIRESTEKKVGTYSAKITNGTGGCRLGYTSGILVAPYVGKTVIVSGWVKSANTGGAATVSLLIGCNGTPTQNVQASYSNSGAWEFLSVALPVPADATGSFTIQIARCETAANAPVYVDGVQFYEMKTGAGLLVDNWQIVNGGGASSVAREENIIKQGVYSAKVTYDGTGTYSRLAYSVASPTTYRGYIMMFSTWVYCLTANRAAIIIYDGVNAPSAIHGGTGWEYLTTSISVDPAASQLNVYFNVSAGAAVAYFDQATFYRSQAPTSWSITGINAQCSRELGTVKVGTYSIKMTRAGTDCYIGQDITTALGGLTLARGKTITAGIWIYATVASRAFLQIQDNILAVTSYHTGVAGWQYITATRTISASSSGIQIFAGLATGDTTAYFDGAFLTDDATANFNFGSGDFTIDCWVRRGLINGVRQFICGNGDGVSSMTCSVWIEFQAGNTMMGMVALSNGFQYYAISTGTITDTTTFHHIELVRSGVNLYLFIDGVLDGTVATLSTFSVNPSFEEFKIGAIAVPVSGYFNGYIDEFRITKGVARHTASFTPQTIAYGNMPTGWTLSGTNAEADMDTGVVKYGTYSLKLTRYGSDALLSQDIQNASGRNIAYWKGKTITYGAWINCSVAGRALIQFNDGVTSVNSSFHTGDGTWQYITLTQTISLTATQVLLRCTVAVGNATAYFDSAMVNEGSMPYAFQEKPLLLTGDGSTSLPGHLVGGDGTMGFNNFVTNGSFDAYIPWTVPTYNSTTLLLHMDGAVNSTTFVDSARGNAVTPYGVAKISTTTSKFGTTSAAFNGTTDYLAVVSDQQLTNGSFETAGAVTPADQYTTLLLHMDDVGLTDSSTRLNTVTKVGSIARSATQSKFGGYSAVLNGSTDYLTVPSDQKLSNGSFETWTGWADLLADGGFEAVGIPAWALTDGGTGAAKARSTEQVKVGTYSGKLTAGTSFAYLQNSYNPGTGGRNNTYVMGAWVWCDTASIAYLFINATSGIISSTTHTGGSTWQYLTATKVCDGTENNVLFACAISATTKIAYFDSATAYVMLNPLSWILSGAGATVAREEGTIKVGTYSARLTRNGANVSLQQSIYASLGTTACRGKTITIGMWAWASVANKARFEFDDGITGANSNYHTGSSTWEYLTATYTISLTATGMTIYPVVNGVGAEVVTAYFDGAFVTDDAVANFNFGSGDFTIDTWAYFSSVSQTQGIFDHFFSGTGETQLVWDNIGARLYFVSYNYSATPVMNYNFSWTPTISTWYHIEAVRSGTNFYIFINGVSQTLTASTPISTNSLPNIDSTFNIGRNTNGSTYFNGYIDEFRVSKGIARHTANFTVKTLAYGIAPASWILAGAGATVDTEESRIKVGTKSAMLTRYGTNCDIHNSDFANFAGLGTTYWKGRTVTFGCWVWASVASRARIVLYDGGTLTVASSYHTGDSTWQYLTVSGTISATAGYVAVACTVITGDTTAYFDGAFVTDDAKANFNFGSGDFTIDTWAYFTDVTTSGSRMIINAWDALANQRAFDFYWTQGTNVLTFRYSSDGGVSTLVTKSVSWTPTISTWYHLEVCRNGNNLYFFVNGTQVGTTQDATGWYILNSDVHEIGATLGGAGIQLNFFYGYLDELRVSKGIARHTAPFTPMTIPYGNTPSSWIMLGANAEGEIVTDIVKNSPYSIKAVAGATENATLYQEVVTNIGGLDVARGKTIALGGWVYCKVANVSYIAIVHYGTGTYFISPFNTGTGWEYLTVSGYIPLDAISVQVHLVAAPNRTAYFEKITVNEGSAPMAFAEPPLMLTAAGNATLPGHLIGGDGTTGPHNNIYNGSFENWSGITELLTNGNMEAGNPPSSWTVFGTGATWTRESLAVKQGAYSGKLTNGGASCGVFQTISNPTAYNGKVMVLSAWVWASQANVVRLNLYMNTGNMAYHSGSGAWEYLTVVATAPAAVTLFQAYLEHIGTSGFAYIDSVTMYEYVTPENWLLAGSGVTATQCEFAKMSAYSLRLSGNSGSMAYQDCWTMLGGGVAPKGKTITVGAWAYATVASRACLRIEDGYLSSYSTTHTGNSTWQYLTVTQTISSSSTVCYAECLIANGSATCYFDGVTVNEGYSSYVFNEPPMIPDSTGNVPLAGHLVGGDGTSLPYNNVLNGSFETYTAGYLQTGPTTLLLHMDDAGLTDSSGRANSITRVGSVARSATQSKFGGYSAAFNGTTDYLTIATDQELTNGSFETWTGLTNALVDGGMEIWVAPWLRSNASIYTDEFTVLTPWVDNDQGTAASTQVTFDSKSCMKLDSGTAGAGNYAHRYQDVGSAGASTYVSMNLYFSALGTYANTDVFVWAIADGTHQLAVSMASDGLYVQNAAGTYVAIGTNPVVQGVWQEWSFVITWGVSATVAIYLNGVFFASGIDCATDSAGVNGTIQFRQNGTTTANRITYIDWLKVGSAFTEPLTNWARGGVGGILQEASIIKAGTYSVRVSGNAAGSTYLEQYVSYPTYFRNKTVVVGAWVWASVASIAYLRITDDDGFTNSATHSGSSAWEYISITRACSGTITYLKPYVIMSNVVTNVYFDSVSMYEQLAPTDWTLAGAGATVAREEGTIKVGTYSAKLTRNGANCYIAQNVWTALGGGTVPRGKTITFGSWVYSNNPNGNNGTILYVNGADGNIGQVTHSTSPGWEYLSTTITIGNSATALWVSLYQNTFNGSAYFDGAFVTDDAVANFNFGASDFTIDCWTYLTSVASTVGFFGSTNTGNSTTIACYWYQPTGNFTFYGINGGATTCAFTFAWSPVISTWYHIEIVRNGTNFYVFINGVSQTLTGTSIATRSFPNVDSTFRIGYDPYSAYYFPGYIDEFRVSKGIARHTANFTPMTISYGNVPTGWTISGVGAEAEIATDIVKVGTYSARFTGTVASAFLVQNFHATLGLSYWKNKVITKGAWVYATVTTKARIGLSDGIVATYSSYHKGMGWEYLTVTHTVSSTATLVQDVFQVWDIVAYFDGSTVNEGYYAYAFSEPPMIPSSAGNVELDGHLIGGDGTTGPHNNIYNGSFENFTAGYAQTGGPTTLLLHMDDVALSDSSLRANAITKVGSVARSATQSKFGGYSAAFNGTTDYLTVPTDQKLANGSFETWTGLTDLLAALNGNMETGTPPSSWSAPVGAGATWAREATIIKEGTYSGKLTRAGTNCYVSQSVTITSNTSYYILSAWVYQTIGTATRAGIQLSIGVNAASAYHSGVATGWEFLSIAVVNTSLVAAGVYLLNYAIDGSVYFDAVKFYLQLAPTGWTLESAGATVAREESTIKVGTYSAKLTRNGTDCGLLQTVSADGIAYRGKTVTIGCWVWASVAASAIIRIVDGISYQYSSAHTGNSTWQYLTVTGTISNSATIFRPELLIITNDTTAYFDGAFVTDDAAANFNFGSGDFTIDTWWRTTDEATSEICSQYENALNYWRLGYNTSTGLKFYAINGGTVVASYDASWTALVGTFYHIEFERTTTTAKAFINGVALSLTETTAFGTQSLKNIDAIAMIGSLNGAGLLNGYLDEFRVSKGLARHIANFTPSTIAYGNNPANWTLVGVGAELDIATDIVKFGSYSAKLIRNGASTYMYPAGALDSSWGGKTITFSCWVWCSTPSIAILRIDDTAATYSASHTGDSTWKYLTVTRTIPAGTAFTFPYLFMLGNGTAYFDGAMVNEGYMPYVFNDPPVMYDGNKNIKILTADKGIDFSINANSAGMTSELLNDYETGTWTPVLTFGGLAVGLTYHAANTGYYTKIGNAVTCWCHLILTNKGSSVGTAVMSGLPFTIASAVESGVAFGYLDALTFTNIPVFSPVQGSATISLVEVTTGGVTSVLTNADFANTTNITFSLTYRV